MNFSEAKRGAVEGLRGTWEVGGSGDRRSRP